MYGPEKGMTTGETGEARLPAAVKVSDRAGTLRAALTHHTEAARQVLPALSASAAPEVRALASELAALGAMEGALIRALDASADAATAGADPKPVADDTQAQTFQSQKLEAIGQLTGGIAHDFNNLLTVITSGLQLLSHTDDTERRNRLTHRIEEAAWRGADLTRRLLAFARRQPLNPQRLDVAPHMEGLRELLRHGLRDDIRILTSIPDGVWPVEADLAALELAILNLAVNARDAMPNGGTMVLGARNAGPDGLGSEPLGLAPGDYVELFVTDTGIGMTPQVLTRVFEPFFTTKPPGKGTGLGLAQVYGFARQSGGTARAESDPAQGTTVAILLPRSIRNPEQAVPAPLAPMRPPRGPAPEHLSVLVVEDDDEVAAVVLEMLDQLGHRGLRVSSLPAAVAVLSGSDCIDLIFSDVLLGTSGSGLDLAREVARRNLQIPLVLTSGYGGGVTGRLAAARLPFLRKPYTIEALRSTLSEALDSEREPAT
jgi:signal transduction histidine kinase/CheY-like chemotaxis protein